MGKTINIWGCCIARDIFSITNDTEFDVDKYITFSSPVSCTRKKLNFLENLDCSTFDLPPSVKRSVEFDLKKNGIEYLNQSDAEWMLIDIADARLNLVEAIIKNEPILIGTKSAYWSKAEKNVLSHIKTFDPFSKLNYIFPWALKDEELHAAIVKFANMIKAKYSQNKIIFNQVRMIPYYVSESGNLKTYNKYILIDERNKIIDKCTRWILEEIPECHVIEMPNEVMGKYNHKWGLSPLHYVDEYYYYALEAVKIIVSENADEKELLKNLKEKYDKYFLELFIGSAKDMINRNDLVRFENESKKLMGYCDFFKKLLYLPNMETRLAIFFRVNQYNRVAFYGNGQITRAMCPILERFGIKVEYIVENENQKSNPKVLPRSTQIYPEVDVMFIADVLNFDEIEKKLKGKVSFPVYRVTDLLDKI